ncbi:hypothetical protein [Halomonas sp. IOP_31]|mgnify:CR=1 FL=1|nr:hypothetical protein [Halomonas sp. IOP_31]
MVRKLLFTGLGSALLLGGCVANTSQVPMATTYPSITGASRRWR